MTGVYSAKMHHLDASALVKLVADDPDEEPGRAVLRQYYRDHPNRRATSYCVTRRGSARKRWAERQERMANWEAS